MTTGPPLHEERSGRVFTRAIRSALSRVPTWLVCSLALWMLALPAGLATYRWFDGAVAHRYAPGSQLAALDVNFRTDHGAALEELDLQVAALGAALVLASWLFGIFSAGGWLQVFLQRTEGHSVRRFVAGGTRYFWRFLRLALLVLLLAHACQWLVFGPVWQFLALDLWLGIPGGELVDLASERTALHATWVQSAVHLVLIALLLTWAIYTRTRLALHETRSVLWAGLCTFFTLLRHPWKAFVPMIAISLVEVLVVWGGGRVRGIFEGWLGPDAGWRALAAVAGWSLFVFAWLEVLHAARYSAAILVSRDVVPPISRPDPWKHSIGAPGGPQYPIIEGDEYGVSL